MVSAIDSNRTYLAGMCDTAPSFTDSLMRGFSAFHRRANQYGTFTTDDCVKDTHEAQINFALKLYRQSKPERRRDVDGFMTAHPDVHGYRGAMMSLLGESNGTSPRAFERLVLLYDAIGSLTGSRGEEHAYSLLSTVSNAVLKMQGEELEAYRAMVAVTTMCIFDDTGMLSGYLTKITGVNSVKPPALHVWNGVLMALRPEYAQVIAACPDHMIRIANAMRASKTKLSPDEMEAVAGKRADEPVAV